MDKFRILSIVEGQSNQVESALNYVKNIYKRAEKDTITELNAEIAMIHLTNVKKNLDKLYEELDATSKEELSR